MTDSRVHLKKSLTLVDSDTCLTTLDVMIDDFCKSHLSAGKCQNWLLRVVGTTPSWVSWRLFKPKANRYFMNCPHCHCTRTTPLQRTTDLGYAVFRCPGCDRTFNERTGTPFNFLEVPTDIVFQVIFCRVRYKLSYRDIAELFVLRGFDFTHETVRAWEERFTLLLADQLRAKRRGKADKVWHVDETYRYCWRNQASGKSLPKTCAKMD